LGLPTLPTPTNSVPPTLAKQPAFGDLSKQVNGTVKNKIFVEAMEESVDTYYYYFY